MTEKSYEVNKNIVSLTTKGCYNLFEITILDQKRINKIKSVCIY